MTTSPSPRKPRVFNTDDPAISVDQADPGARADGTAQPPPAPGEIRVRPTATELQSGIRWGSWFLSAMASLAALAASLAFLRFVSVALERNDWIGWIAFGLLAIAAVSAAVLIARELIGLMRLARLSQIRKDVGQALTKKDDQAERKAFASVQTLFASRPDCRWSLAKLKEHASDVGDAGDLLRLAELVAPLDMEARRAVLKSAKRVATVTALSPMAWISMLFVVIENLRLMRGLATLYGGRPGAIGAMRLGRLVVGHIVATGGVAMTDDLMGQFLGQDLLRRVSARLGEGAFNGALTARLGVAAIEVTRPLPFLDAPPIRVRDIIREVGGGKQNV
jgi:putative membrane protein